MTDGVLARIARGAGAIILATAVAGCAGSQLFPLSATLPASWGQAYAEVKDKDPATAQLSPSTALFLSGLDPLAAKPTMPAKPREPRPSPLATDPFPLAQLRMPTRPPPATACSAIAAAVGGTSARCGTAQDEELRGDVPDGVPAGAMVVGRAYVDGRMILLDRPGQSAAMWDAAMHERGHLLATWLCGRADCLDAKLTARGHEDGESYLRSLVEGFAQSWAQCQGAELRTEYRQLPCTDVAAVVAQAQQEKRTAKAAFEREKSRYAAEMVTYENSLGEYDRVSEELEVLSRFSPAQGTRS